METVDGAAPHMERSRSHGGTARHIIDSMEKMGSRSTVGATGRVAVHSPVHSPATGRVLVRSAKPRSPEIAMVPSGEKTPLLGDGVLLDAEGYAVEESPPLIIWIGPALACALAYALYNIFIKKGSASINPVLGGVVLQLYYWDRVSWECSC